MASSPLFVGVDVAKATLDIALRPRAQTWQVIYDDTHVEAFVTQLNEPRPPSSWSKPLAAWSAAWWPPWWPQDCPWS